MSLTQEQKDTIREEYMNTSFKNSEEEANWWLKKLDQAYQQGADDQNRKANSGRLLYQDGYKQGAKDKVEELEVSCVRDSLLGKSDEYLKGWNDCSTEWRRVRDEFIKR